MAFFEVGDVRLMLAEHEGGSERVGSILYFSVDDVHAARATLGDRGVEFDQEPVLIAEMEDHDLWMAFFRDPDGNQLALMSQVPRR